MDFFNGIKEKLQGIIGNIAEWSLSTKLMAGACTFAVVGLLAAAGLMIHDALAADAVEAAAEPEEPAEEVVEIETVAEEPVTETVVSVDIPTFVACRVSGDSLEKDLTLYIKGNESNKKISGTKFEIKLIKPEAKGDLSKYVTDIDAITEKLDRAKTDKTYDNMSGKTVGDVLSDANATTSSYATKDVELTVGEELLFEKEIAIAAYKDALSAMKGDTYVDSDSDGMIYIQAIAAGDYIACFVPTGDYDAVDYMTSVNVKEKVEYKKVATIDDKVVSAAEAGDVKPAEITPVEATLTDTVEYVASTSELVSGGATTAAPSALAPYSSGSNTDTKEYKLTSSAGGGARFAAASGGMSFIGGMSFASASGGRTAVMLSSVIGDSSNTGDGDTENSGDTNSSGSGTDSGATDNTSDSGTGSNTGDSGNTTEPATPTPASFILSSETLSLTVGTAGTVTANGTGVDSYAVTSSNTSVATAAVSGSTITVTPVAAGTAVISVSGTPVSTYSAPAAKNITVTVKAAPTATATLTVPATVTLYAKSGINSFIVTPTLSNATLTEAVSSAPSIVTATLSSDKKSVVLTGSTELTSAGSAKITFTALCSDGTTTLSAVTDVTVVGSATQIKDAGGNALYTDEELKTAATVADYAIGQSYYVKGSDAVYKYTGWQSINGSSYYYTKDGVAVTGTQVIQGVQYNFGSDGALLVSGTGIDVSRWQGSIDWSQASTAVGFAIIRCGFRGSSGNIAVDPMFLTNAQGAKANGVKIGLYFYSKATTEAQAVEEASLAIECAQQAGGLSYPIYIDMEDSTQLGLSNEQRTAIVNAFCATVRSSGYSAGLYANKNWLTNYINTGSLSGVSIWCAQYNTTCTYGGRKEMWQYTSSGSVPGISGNVDMDISYF